MELLQVHRLAEVEGPGLLEGGRVRRLVEVRLAGILPVIGHALAQEEAEADVRNVVEVPAPEILQDAGVEERM